MTKENSVPDRPKIIIAPSDRRQRRILMHRLAELQTALPEKGLETSDDILAACQIVVLKSVLDFGRIDTDQLYEVFIETNPMLKPWLEADMWMYKQACQQINAFCQGRDWRSGSAST